MLTYKLNKELNIPLYEQLYTFIKKDIRSGVIVGDSKLPSKRAFSEHLGVSKVTVEAAYALLISEGFVYSKEKMGYYAENNLFLMPEKKPACNYSENKEPEYKLDLSSNTVPANQFPFTAWTSLMRTVCLDNSRELLSPIPYNGTEVLRNSISRYLFEQRGAGVEPDRIVIGAGAEYLYSVIISLLGKTGIFAYEDPTYHKIASSYEKNDVKTAAIKLDSDGINMRGLEGSNASVVHISPSHNFPTGIVYSSRRKNEILQWANGADDRYIIEDDFDSELRFTGKPLSPILSSDSNGKVIYINSFSKTIAPSVRIGYMVLPSKLAEKFKNEFSGVSCTVSSFEQYTLAGFIDKGFFERHINRTKKYYKVLREKLFSVYENSGCNRYTDIIENPGGLHFLLKLKENKDETLLKQKFSERKVKVSFLSEYYKGKYPYSTPCILINYSGLSESDFAEALKITKEILKEDACEN